MNVMRAFVFGTSGKVNDHQMQQYQEIVRNNYEQVKSMGGAFANTADAFYDKFNQFVTSREWELSSILASGDSGENINRFDIGAYRTLGGLQSAQTTMRDYIMAMPGVMEAYQEGHLSGYEGDIAAWCNGTLDNNLFYRRQQHGVVGFRPTEGYGEAYHKHYFDSIAPTHLSSRERFDLATTRHTVAHYMAAKVADFTSSKEDAKWITEPEKK